VYQFTTQQVGKGTDFTQYKMSQILGLASEFESIMRDRKAAFLE